MSDNGANVLRALLDLEDIGSYSYEAILNILDPTFLQNHDADDDDDDDTVGNANNDLEQRRIRRAINLLQKAYEDGSTGEHFTPVALDIRALCNGMNGCKCNACVPHTAQVLLKEVINSFEFLLAIKTRISDLAAFCTGRAEVRRRIKFASGKTMLVAPTTRWNFIVSTAYFCFKLYKHKEKLHILYCFFHLLYSYSL